MESIPKKRRTSSGNQVPVVQPQHLPQPNRPRLYLAWQNAQITNNETQRANHSNF